MMERSPSWRDTPSNHGPHVDGSYHGGPFAECVWCGTKPMEAPRPVLDLDELERKSKAGGAALPESPQWATWLCVATPATVLALIERVRAAEIVGSEWMALQEAAGFPKDGMVRSVKDVSDSVVLMAERLRELEKQCAENAAFAQKALEREVLGRSRIAKLEKKLAEAPANYENGDAFEKDITT